MDKETRHLCSKTLQSPLSIEIVAVVHLILGHVHAIKYQTIRKHKTTEINSSKIQRRQYRINYFESKSNKENLQLVVLTMGTTPTEEIVWAVPGFKDDT